MYVERELANSLSPSPFLLTHRVAQTDISINSYHQLTQVLDQFGIVMPRSYTVAEALKGMRDEGKEGLVAVPTDDTSKRKGTRVADPMLALENFARQHLKKLKDAGQPPPTKLRSGFLCVFLTHN